MKSNPDDTAKLQIERSRRTTEPPDLDAVQIGDWYCVAEISRMKKKIKI